MCNRSQRIKRNQLRHFKPKVKICIKESIAGKLIDTTVYWFVKWFDVLRYYDVCWYCGQQLTERKEEIYLPNLRTIDHKIPSHQGGMLEPDNVVFACTVCNELKDSKTVEEYRSFLEKLKERNVIFFGEEYNKYIFVGLQNVANQHGMGPRC